MTPEGVVEALLKAKDAVTRQSLLLPRDEDFYVAVVNLLKDQSDSERLRDPRAALEIIDVAFHVADFAQSHHCRAVASWAKGNVLIHQGEYGDCLELYEKAARFFGAQGAEIEAARLTANRAWVFKNLGRYEEGVESAEKALSLLSAHPPSRFLASTWNLLGTLHRLSGRYEQAVVAFEEGEEIYTSLDDRVNGARLAINKANVLRDLDRFNDAIDLLQRSRATLTQYERTMEVARADLNLGIVYSRVGHYDEALAALDRAEEGFKSLDNAVDRAVVDLYRSDLYAEFNLIDDLLQVATQDWQFFEDRQMQRHAARATLHKAVALRRLNDSVRAEELLDDAQAAFTRMKDMVWVRLIDLERAALWCQRENWARALPLLVDIVAFLRAHDMPLRAASASLLLAQCYMELGELSEATAHLRQVLNSAQSRDVPALLYRAHHGLGRVARRQGRSEEALAHLRRAVDVLESMRQRLRVEDFRLGFLEDKLRVYHDAVLLCLEMGQEEEAFAYVERVKSGALVDLLVSTLERRPVGIDVVNENLAARLSSLRRRLNWHYNKLEGDDEVERGQSIAPSEGETWQQIAATEQEAVRAWRDLQRMHPFYTSLGNPDLHSTTSCQANLGEDEILLQYHVIREVIHLFVVSQNGLYECVQLRCTTREVEESIAAFGTAISAVSAFGVDYVTETLLPLCQQQLAWLYDDLLRPVAPLLDGARRLLIAPDDLLFEVPFHALYDGNRYLLDSHEVAYAPSAGALGLCRENSRRRPAPSGPPVVAGCTECGLPHIRNEVESVARAFPDATVLLESDVTLDGLRDGMDRSALLHLATHAVFRRDNPLFSALRLSGGDWLRVMDLYTLQLHGALVTLSGCETGRHRLLGGDVLGLSRGFFCAGASALVTSLWPVDDVSTAVLMAQFYTRLAGGETAAAALRSAQQSLRDQEEERDGRVVQPYHHPFHWAVFGLMGMPDLRVA